VGKSRFIKVVVMKVIIDCDSGNDDSWAIISLLRAEEKCDYKVIAITCVNGNTTVDHSSLNTLLVLKTLNRLDVPVIDTNSFIVCDFLISAFTFRSIRALSRV
jgi:inosine-uridine nucleoside N-ribohydrolase